MFRAFHGASNLGDFFLDRCVFAQWILAARGVCVFSFALHYLYKYIENGVWRGIIGYVMCVSQ